MSLFPPVIELSSLDGSTGFRINGEVAGDQSGVSVSAGDINGDGFDDVIIGAYQSDPHGSSSGATYVVFGGAAEFLPNVELSSLTGAYGFQISGVAAGYSSGAQLLPRATSMETVSMISSWAPFMRARTEFIQAPAISFSAGPQVSPPT